MPLMRIFPGVVSGRHRNRLRNATDWPHGSVSETRCRPTWRGGAASLDARDQVPDGLVARRAIPLVQRARCETRLRHLGAVARQQDAISRRSHQVQDELFPQASPLGGWMACQSNRTGRHEIYLRPFPGGGADVAVSNQGGTQPRWHPNGRELSYVTIDNRLMTVALRFSADGQREGRSSPVNCSQHRC